MNAYTLDEAGLWIIARRLFEFEQSGDGERFPLEKAPADVQMNYRMRARDLSWEYASSLEVHPVGVTGEVSVGLVDAAGGLSPRCEVCDLDARGYVVDPTADDTQRFACLGHLGILAAVVLAYDNTGIAVPGRLS